MAENYYKPTTNELLQGMELKLQNFTGDWVDYKIKDSLTYQTAFASVLEDKAEVKYLDDDDIKRLGFVFLHQTVRGGNPNIPISMFIKEDITINYKIKTNNLIIFIIDKCVFDGKIKTLSEFKVLLKQLDIEYE